MQNKTTGYEALTAIYQPDAVFVEYNSKDYSLTREILSRLSHVPVYEIDDIGQLEKEFKVSRSDVFGEGKKESSSISLQWIFFKEMSRRKPRYGVLQLLCRQLIKKTVSTIAPIAFYRIS